MNRLNISVILCILFISGCAPKSPQNVSHLQANIQKKLDGLEGDFALAFKSLSDTTESIFINEREKFHAASTMKTPVMIELFRQAANGQFSLEDSILVKNEFRSIVDSSRYEMSVDEDSEGGLYNLIGERRTIHNLISNMITMSSNLATNILIEKVGAKNVTQTMRDFGADSIQVLRGVEDIKAYEQGLSNRTTAYDEMKIYEKLASGEAVSTQASEEMIDILKQQEFNEMIPGLLPDSVEVAHKTGWITGVNHDAGIVLLPDGRRYVLIMLSKNAPERDRVLSTFAGISREIYDYVAR